MENVEMGDWGAVEIFEGEALGCLESHRMLRSQVSRCKRLVWGSRGTGRVIVEIVCGAVKLMSSYSIDGQDSLQDLNGCVLSPPSPAHPQHHTHADPAESSQAEALGCMMFCGP